MAVDMFIKIDDQGRGEGRRAQGRDRRPRVELGHDQSGSAHMGGGAGAGKVNVQDLSFTKYVDMSSPDLMLSCCNGKH